jgi:sugar/nucleoside kinase (ribokinase family)
MAIVDDSGPKPVDAPHFDLDVVGVGAFNLDYIANVATPAAGATPGSLEAQIAALFADKAPPFEWGVEHLVDEETMYAALAEVNAVSLNATLGGSAFNAIFALAKMKLGLRLGYVGVAGRVPIPGMSSLQQLEALEVDHRFVRRDDSRLCGICLSMQSHGERTLLTHIGANEQMADHLNESFEDITKYMASARAVHITSFLDSSTAEHLLAVLQAVKKRSPETLISFDPGHVWTSTSTEAIDGITGIADYLLLNYREFKQIGCEQPGEPDERIAERLLHRFGDGLVVVVKRTEGIQTFSVAPDGMRHEFFRQEPLNEEEIEDSTGAGDVFAAGLLAVVTSDRLQVELGSLLGMELARHKLRFVGTRGHTGFAGIAKGFIPARAAERRTEALPKGVFVAHGGDPRWRAVKAFIEEECKLPVFSFESGVWGSTQVTEALNQYLEQCGFAVCVLTAEDMSADGRRWARQNVVHEVGLFQGRYGFDRVLLLVEEGCEYLPNTTEPFTVMFPKGSIDSTFWRVNKMFQTHGLRQTAGATT